MKPKYIIFLGVILLISIAIYVSTGGSRSSVEAAHSKSLLSSHSAKSYLSSSSSTPTSESVSSLPDSDKGVVYRYKDFNKYYSQLPELKRFENTSRNAIYSVGVDVSESQLKELKELSESGDVAAKSIYANRLAAKLYARLQEDMALHNGEINKEKWQQDFAGVQKLLIEAAASGEYLATVQLTMYPPEIVTGDREELMAWSLIADRLNSSGGAVQRTCLHFSNPCTNELMEKSIERAYMYIDLYKMKTLYAFHQPCAMQMTEVLIVCYYKIAVALQPNNFISV